MSAKVANATVDAEAAERGAEADGVEVADAWSAFVTSSSRPQCSDATLRQYHFQWDRFAVWAKKQGTACHSMSQVRQRHVDDYLATLEVGPNTWNKHVALLRMVWKVLARRIGSTVNPWDGVARRYGQPSGRRELSREELTKVLDTAGGELRTLLMLGAYTGLRLGDCCTLKWDEVKADTITRIPNKGAKRGVPVIVPVHPELREHLERIARMNEYVLPRMAAEYVAGSHHVTDIVQAHLSACGMATTVNGPRGRATVQVGFHSLRHTFVSLQSEAGTPMAVVQAIVGHGSPAMTRHYTHIGIAAARRAIDAMPALTSKGALASRDDVAKLMQALRRVLRAHRELPEKADGARIRAATSALAAIAWK